MVDYLNPELPSGLKIVRMPVVLASDASLEGLGRLIDDPKSFPIEIVRWPASGWRPVDEDSGDQGGTTEGRFLCYWEDDILFGRNDAVGGHYVLGYADLPESSSREHQHAPSRVLIWHANYHPDGGQLFFPLERKPFLVPLARPGDDVVPEDFVCFAFDGTRGVYIHPNVWHEGVFTCSREQRFFDKQGAVHARVSIDFAREFQCLLEARFDPVSNTLS